MAFATPLALMGLVLVAFAIAPAAANPNERSPADIAREAVSLEELGAYAQAADLLRGLNERIEDADLALALALDEARSGHYEESASLLWGPLLSKAAHDTLPTSRFHEYPWGRDELWVNGQFDGWHWYVVRARAEVAAQLGRWDDALEAARATVAAHPLAGKEWLQLALCQARTGDDASAITSARRAAYLDPTLPEAPYLLGLLEWRAGRRNAAQDAFRAAVEIDSTFGTAALALVRSQVPFARPDSLPVEFLTGNRRAGLLTSKVRPKADEFVQMDEPAEVIRPGPIHLPDSIEVAEPITLSIPVLVDTHGSIILHELTWYEPERLPARLLGPMLAALLETRFRPGTLRGRPYPVWAGVNLRIEP